MPPKRDNDASSQSTNTADIQHLIQLTTNLVNQIASQSATMNDQTEAIKNLAETLTNSTHQLHLNDPNQQRPPPPLPPTHQQPRPPKIFLPTFDGSNPLDWIFQADNYFTYYAIPPDQRLLLFVFYFTGDALSWYKHLSNNNLLSTWPEFIRALETRFGPSTYENHQATIFKHRQTSTVASYQTNSNVSATVLPGCLTRLFGTVLSPDYVPRYNWRWHHIILPLYTRPTDWPK
nr:hypothetical protein [Tanacetum cinerariifolium]